MEHYHLVKGGGDDPGRWAGKNGSIRGKDTLERALEITRPSWLGYHGYAREFQADNPDLLRRLANRVGYWYFPAELELPEKAPRGRAAQIAITWTNRGLAPAYHPFVLRLRLAGGTAARVVTAPSDNRRWLPGQDSRETYSLPVPADLAPGEYELGVSLTDEAHGDPRPVRLGLVPSTLEGGFYRLASLAVE
jgi:hypothetical protein